MSADAQNTVPFAPEPVQTLGDFVRAIWQARRFVLAGFMIAVLAAFVVMRLAAPHFRAHMVLAPANPMQMAASMSASLPFAPAESNVEMMSFTRFEASFKGTAVAGLLLRDPEITDGLAWDKAFSFSEVEQEWSPEKLAEYIARRVAVDPVGETPLRRLVYLHPDRDFAVLFLQRLHNITDGLIRHGMRREVNERITYLNKAISENMNPEHRRALTALLMEQERLKMLVSIDQPYAASVVVPASSSAKARWPDAALVYAGFAFVGALFGFAVFGARKIKRDDVFAALPSRGVKQQDWFFPESGNSNEKPGFSGARKALTEKKRSKKSAAQSSGVPSEAAE